MSWVSIALPAILNASQPPITSPFSSAISASRTFLPAVATSFSDFSHGSSSATSSVFAQLPRNSVTASVICLNSVIRAVTSASPSSVAPLLIASVTLSSVSFRYSDSGKPAGTRPDPGQFDTFLAMVRYASYTSGCRYLKASSHMVFAFSR